MRGGGGAGGGRVRGPVRRTGGVLGGGSAGAPAAVERQGDAGDVAAVAGAQPQRGGGDLVRLQQPFHGGTGQQLGGQDVTGADAVRGGLVADLVLHQRGADVAGVDAVAGDAVRGALDRGHLAQPLQGVLGGDVGRLVGAGPDAVHAGDVDQPAPAARVHVRQAAAHQQERGGDHHLLDEVEPV